MKRRTALIRLTALAGLASVSYVGFRWLRLNSAPNIASLGQQKKLIAALADVIIPKTDSPSASECGVQDFVIKMVIDCSDSKTQNNFLTGLEEVEEYSQSHYSRSFVDCSNEEKNDVLTFFDAQDNSENKLIDRVQRKIFGKTFFATLREYAVIGYFYSEQGATQALRYSLVPSTYIACQPYSGEKAWATF